MATRPATREEIVQCDADLRELLGVMHERSAGGSSKQGRYLKPDTARRRYIKTVALPGLRYGKLPPDADYRILFLDPADWELPANKAEHDAWVKRHELWSSADDDRRRADVLVDGTNDPAARVARIGPWRSQGMRAAHACGAPSPK